MIDFSNTPIGTKFGARYSYIDGKIGTFDQIVETPNTKCIKTLDPLTVYGSNFKLLKSDVNDEKMFRLLDSIVLNTKRVFPTTSHPLGDGREQITDEMVDLTHYKKNIDFSTSTGDVILTAIPKDGLLVTKDLCIGGTDGALINTIAIKVTNVFCKVAITNDGSTFYTFNPDTTTWSTVNLSHDTDTLKTEMMDYTVLNAITAEQYALQFSTKSNYGLAILTGIEIPDDFTYNAETVYSVDSIVFDSTDANTAAGATITQYFNFIFGGYNMDGDAILYADRPIQNNISYKLLYDAGLVNATNKVTVAKSDLGAEVYMRLPETSIDRTFESEWDELISKDGLGLSKSSGAPIQQVYNTEMPSYTNTVASSAFRTTELVTPVQGDIVTRGGLGANYFNAGNFNTVSTKIGWRPVAIVKLNTGVKAEHPSNALPVVDSLADFVPGTCMSCDYEYDSTKIGAFKNLGKSIYGLLSDYRNQISGSFYFICVGYDREGRTIAVADRPVVTGMNYSSLTTGMTPTITGVDGYTVSIDTLDQKIRFPFTSIGHDAADPNEYDTFINNSYDETKTVDEIWHTSKTMCWTNTQYAGKDGFMVLKGFGTNHQRIRDAKSTTELDDIGYRPVLIIQPHLHVELLEVTPYVGYEVKPETANYICNIRVLDKRNVKMSYKLVNNADGSIISGFGDKKQRIISVSKFEDGKATTINIVTKDPETNKEVVVKSFDVFKDAPYRTSTKRIFGEYYGGWGSTANVHYKQDKPNASRSTARTVIVSGDVAYVPVNKFTTKLSFNK